MSGVECFVLSYLLNSLWQVPLLFAAGWLAARALRRVGPGTEHRVWVSVLLLGNFLPACSGFASALLHAFFSGSGLGERAGAVRVSMGAGAVAGGGSLSGQRRS